MELKKGLKASVWYIYWKSVQTMLDTGKRITGGATEEEGIDSTGTGEIGRNHIVTFGSKEQQKQGTPA